jgi:Na+/H+-translocating membrane pyrophosphatase
MLRGFSRPLVKKILSEYDGFSFVPVLAYSLCENYFEIKMQHLPRAFGSSNYSCQKLVITGFDLMSSSSTMPVHIIAFLGIVFTVIFGVLFGFSLLLLCLLLFSFQTVLIVFGLFMLSFIILSIGIVGEYVIRINRKNSS